MRVFLSCFLLLFVALRPSSGLASDTSTAELLFQKGRAAMVAQDFQAACQLFRESLALDPAVGTLMNLAACEQKVENYATSYQRWQEALIQLEDDDPRRAYAQEQAEAVDKNVSRLILNIAPNTPSSLTILCDEEKLDTNQLGQPLRLNPGAHLVVVKSEGYKDKRYHFPLDPGQRKALSLTVGPALSKSASAPTPEQSAHIRRIAGYTALGVGAAGVVGLVVTGVLLQQKKGIVNKHCPNERCDETGFDAVQQSRTLLPLNTASWIVGGLSVAAGSALLLTLPRKEQPAAQQGRDKDPGTSPQKAARRSVQNLGLLVRASEVSLVGSF